MSILTVGQGEEYSTIAAAVLASMDGDTIAVDAGTYTNDFAHITHSLTLESVGGMVTMAATVQPPDGKAILTEGAPGLTVAIDGFAFTGATVPDANGAGIRYEGGTLTIANSYFYDNQNGILGGPDPNGIITITHSEFADNGVGGQGYTHNIYIGDIQSFTLTDSFTHDANVGHEIKSRAENNIITDNRILDNASTSSYEIDLPNGGNALISGNTIQQGVNSQNARIIVYGEEGSLHDGTSLNVTSNTIVNDLGRGAALTNASGGTVANFSDNAVYGFGTGALVDGAAVQNGTVVLTARPALDQSPPFATPAPALTLAYFDTSPVPVTADLATGLWTAGGAAGVTAGDEGLVGSAFADTLTGDANTNLLAGGPGNDTLNGGGGDDALFGQQGDDVLYGGDGDDLLRGGEGADTLDGGAGFNLAIYDTAATGVTASLLDPALNTGEAAGDIYTNIQGFLGSPFADLLIGSGQSDLLLGGDGNDTLVGGVGDDVMDAGGGDNVFAFDPGFQFDHVGGFQAGPATGVHDVLSFSDSLFATAQAALAAVFTDPQGNAFVYAGIDPVGGGPNAVVLAGVSAAQLTLANFAIHPGVYSPGG